MQTANSEVLQLKNQNENLLTQSSLLSQKVEIQSTTIDSLRKEIRIAAIKAAKTKADYLLNAIGEQTGKPLIVRENSVLNENVYTRNVNRVSNYSNTRFLEESDKSTDDEEIQFQKIKIQSSIYVKFLIK